MHVTLGSLDHAVETFEELLHIPDLLSPKYLIERLDEPK